MFDLILVNIKYAEHKTDLFVGGAEAIPGYRRRHCHGFEGLSFRGGSIHVNPGASVGAWHGHPTQRYTGSPTPQPSISYSW